MIRSLPRFQGQLQSVFSVLLPLTLSSSLTVPPLSPSLPQQATVSFFPLTHQARSLSSHPLPTVGPAAVSEGGELEVTRALTNTIVSQLQDDIPRALPVIGLLKNAVEGRVLCKLYTDSWPSFTSLVCEIVYPRVSKVSDLVCYTRGSGEDVLQLLLSNHLISWGKRQQIYHVESGLSEYLCENLRHPSSGERVLTSSFEAVVAYLPKGIDEIPCLDGFLLASLRPQHAPLVTRYWRKYDGWPRNTIYIESLISDFSTKAVYSLDNLDTPVAWILQYPFGRLGGLYTQSEYRYNDLGTLLTVALSREIAESGLMPEALTEVGNKASRRITAKLGFIESQYHLSWLVSE